MQETATNGQGFPGIIDPETGNFYPLIRGGSDGGVAVDDGGSGQASSGSGDGGSTVVDGGEGAQSGSGSGQGFFDQYLAEVPEENRDLVSQVLENYRKDQDAEFNRRFEQRAEETKTATTLYQALLEDPVGTVNWIADQYSEQRDLDLRNQLAEHWGLKPAEPQPTGDGSESEDKPLTQKQLDEILERREQERQQQVQKQQTQQEQAKRQRALVETWLGDAAKTHGLEFQGEDDPIRETIILRANQLHEAGTARGQAAIEMATEQVAGRLSPAAKSGGSPSPKPADGGSPPPAKEIDVSDKSQRRARMEELFLASQQPNG